MRESYNTPESVSATAKKRGMDLVTITDHDQISGRSTGAAATRRPMGVHVVGCEVTAEWPDLDLCVHLNMLDITPVPARRNPAAARRCAAIDAVPASQKASIPRSITSHRGSMVR